MIQFKRFFILIYLHLFLSVLLTYLSSAVVFSVSFFSQDWQKTLFGLACVTMIYFLIGILWGLISSEKKKLLLPLGLYVLVLIGFFVFALSAPERWIIYLNANIPYAYFIRNVATRPLWINIIHALGTLLPSWALFTGFKLSARFSSPRATVTQSEKTGSFPI